MNVKFLRDEYMSLFCLPTGSNTWVYLRDDFHFPTKAIALESPPSTPNLTGTKQSTQISLYFLCLHQTENPRKL